MTAEINTVLNHFLQLEKEARNAKDLHELAFIICNLSKKLVVYNQAIIWRNTNTGIKIHSVSAISNINRKSPYIHWLEKSFIPWLTKTEPNKCQQLKDAPQSLQKQWQENLPGNAIFYPITSIEGKNQLGGMLFAVTEPWLNSQQALAEELFAHYQHCWQRLAQKEKYITMDKFWFKRRKNLIKLCVFFIIGISLFVPVEQTIITKAKIAPQNPILVSASINGIINKIYVKPNQQVEKGQILFSLDKITLTHKVMQARKETLVARERYRRAYQHAYTNQESRAELALLESEVKKSDSELNYQLSVLKRADIHALHSGTVIFSAPKYWLGKPINVGEQIMLLAKVANKQLDADIPQADMITINKGAKVKFYPNTDPLKPLNASVIYASYVANESHSGELTYHIACQFTSTKKIPRFGAQGSAKIYGEKVSLFFYLFRRPLIYIQSLLGI